MKKRIKLTEDKLRSIVRNVLNEVKERMEFNYEVDFTFFISLGENKEEYNQSIAIKDDLLDLLDTMPEIIDYEVDRDDEDWCIDCIANVTAEDIEHASSEMENLLSNIDCTWDYHYIKGLDTDEYWQP